MRTLIALPMLLLAGCAPALADLDFTPHFSPSREQIPLANACGGVARVAASDARDEKAIAGYRFAEHSPDKRFTIKLEGEAKEWLQSGAESALLRAGLALAMPNRPDLELKLLRLDLEEQTMRNASYSATVRYEVTLKLGDKTCFSGAVEGSDERYGRPGSVENYREALNGAFDRAAVQLLNNQAFLDALCSACGSVQPREVSQR